MAWTSVPAGCFSDWVSGAKQVAEKVEFSRSGQERRPSGAKALVDLTAFAAVRDESLTYQSCPFKTALPQEFFRSL